MFARVKELIETHINLIDDNNFESLFQLAVDSVLNTAEISELSEILEHIGVDTEAVRWEVFDNAVIEYINYYIGLPGYLKDKSNSWARVDYMLDEITNVGFGWHAAKQHVLNNSAKYGTTITKLSPEYGWQGAGDYAFDWFNSVEFDKEYNYE